MKQSRDPYAAAVASILAPMRVPRCRYCRAPLPTAQLAYEHGRTDCRTPAQRGAALQRREYHAYPHPPQRCGRCAPLDD